MLVLLNIQNILITLPQKLYISPLFHSRSSHLGLIFMHFVRGYLTLASRYTTPRDPSPVTINPQPPRCIFTLTGLSNDVLCPTRAHGVGQRESSLKNKNKESSQVMQWHFELISAATWRVLHRFLACSLQTAQTVMKSSLMRTHARTQYVPACAEYIYQSNLLHPFILLASPASISASTEATQQNPTVVDTHLRGHAL